MDEMKVSLRLDIGEDQSGPSGDAAKADDDDEVSTVVCYEVSATPAVISATDKNVTEVVDDVVGPSVARVVDKVAEPPVRVVDDVAGPSVTVVEEVAGPSVRVVEEVARPSVRVVEEVAGSSDKNAKKTTQMKKTGTKTQTAKVAKEKHYASRVCPICQKTVCNLSRHLKALHVNKNEFLPEIRIKPLMEMARHGNKIKGGGFKTKTKGGENRVYLRVKEICPKCDSVVLYLSKHLRKVHGLAKDSDEYQMVLRLARPFYGRTSEMLWDTKIIHEKRKGSFLPSPKSYKRLKQVEQESDSDDEEKGPKKSPLELLAEELLPSESSDEDFEPNPNTIPATPLKGLKSFMTTAHARKEPEADHDDVASEEPEPDHDDASADGSDANDQGDSSKSEEEDGSDEEKSEEGSGEEKMVDDSEDEEDERSSDSDYEEDESSESDDEADFSTWKEYYREGKAGSLIDELIIKYYSHLQHIIGGCKKEGDAILHAQNVRRIHDSIDSQDSTLECVISNGGLEVWNSWAKPLFRCKKVPTRHY